MSAVYVAHTDCEERTHVLTKQNTELTRQGVGQGMSSKLNHSEQDTECWSSAENYRQPLGVFLQAQAFA